MNVTSRLLSLDCYGSIFHQTFAFFFITDIALGILVMRSGAVFLLSFLRRFTGVFDFFNLWSCTENNAGLQLLLFTSSQFTNKLPELSLGTRDFLFLSPTLPHPYKCIRTGPGRDVCCDRTVSQV